MKILLVEDSPTLRHTTSSFISSAGHEPVTAESGEAALQLIENEPVDMIVMDVEMPGLNGFETTRLIREWLGDHWIPIIFVTGKNDDESYKEGIEAGGDDYLIKPISEVILQAKITAMERITSMRNQMHQLNQKLEILSQIDGLTQIYNRRTFTDLAKREWLKTSREQQSVTILMVDIDHFKLYNDHYGHPAGDACLAKVAKTIKGALHRPTDLLGRYGGEEFIIFLPNTDRWDSVHVAERVRQSIEDLAIEHSKSTTQKHLTLSIGGAVCAHTTGRTMEEVVKLADEALYRAKREGRNCVMIEESKPVKRVLIADDDDDTLKLLSDILSNHCQILTTNNGIECLNLVKQTKPDLVLLDIHMPKLDGLSVCKTLKEQPGTASIPIIFISSEDRDEQVRLGKQVGANDCLQKPLNEKQLLSKIHRYLL